MELPQDKELPINELAQVFRHRVSSYKFYWLLAIIEDLEINCEEEIPKQRLVDRMLKNVWYPLDYFKLSFGFSDNFNKIADFVNSYTQIDHSPGAPDLFSQLRNKLDEPELKEFYKRIDDLKRFVPYRLISPFFNDKLQGMKDYKKNDWIKENAEKHFSTRKPFYYIKKETIVLHPKWVTYFLRNLEIIKSFIFWHLLQFVQKQNPNVIGLSQKLFKPGSRNFAIANKFWKHYLKLKGSVQCIYSGKNISGNYDIDHFIPWRYAVHDQLWNLVPARPEVNASKSDKLPDLSRYLDAFTALQYDAFHAIYAARVKRRDKLLEDYVQLFQENLVSIAAYSKSSFQDVIASSIKPMEQIAKNSGFQAHWKY